MPQNNPSIPISPYCEFIVQLKLKIETRNHSLNSLHKVYHDTQYGFPLDDDDQLFGRLILEINQAGLSWSTILAKQDNFHKAYHQFKIKKVANYKEKDQSRLLSDVGIIRNRLKVNAAIYNAQVILSLQKKFGSFKNWLDHHLIINKNDNPRKAWTELFRKNFKFTGGEIVNEFLISTGYLPGAHSPSCPIYKKIIHYHPPWTRVK